MCSLTLRGPTTITGAVATRNTNINSYRKKQRQPAEYPTEQITDWQLASNFAVRQPRHDRPARLIPG
ncbi:hypothetical protein GR254_02320, partial [Mycobacterium tuberculosis]|nr:hypothetical protein [Mycobacterium tuberculosis]